MYVQIHTDYTFPVQRNNQVIRQLNNRRLEKIAQLSNVEVFSKAVFGIAGYLFIYL